VLRLRLFSIFDKVTRRDLNWRGENIHHFARGQALPTYEQVEETMRCSKISLFLHEDGKSTRVRDTQ
jgi:hypothetical protein